MLPAYELVSGAAPVRALVLLHGVLGSGRNLRTLAQRLVDARPDWLAVLLDLRAHGESVGLVDGEDTVAGAAADVVSVARTLPVPVRAVLGHSLGGKVALATPGAGLDGLEHLVVVDSNPGRRPDARGSELTLEVVSLLERLPGPWPRRDAFVADVEAAGSPRHVAQWLAMSMRRDPDGLRFALELPRIRALLASYFATDLWPVVERAAQERTPPRVHLVIGDASPVLAPADRDRARALAATSGGFVTVEVVPGGHWVHVEAFERLLAVLVQLCQ